MDFFDKLNKNQAQAVMVTDGPLLILAGAGSGKTRVITHRIAHLIEDKGVNPYNIFAVTFTNKAAQEMKERIIKLIGPQGNNVFIKTFHSASVFMLRRYGEKIAIPQGFSIYDQKDQQSVIKEILIAKKLDPKKIKPATIASKISEIKDKSALIEGADINQYMPDYHGFDFSEIYAEYNQKLKENSALDFNDLIIEAVKLVRSCPEVLESLQNRWHYFMVDEYQDTNYAQYLLTKYLCEKSKNICVVGDDDQSIYSWRGADIKNILNFEKDYTNALVITLGENYRSTEEILQSAAAVISHNINRKEKQLRSFRGSGEKPIWVQNSNEYAEAEFVVNKIITHKYQENLTNRDFAIFYRTNAQSRIFEEQLRKENIPYRVVGGLKFYDRKEIKDIVAYLRFIINLNDSVSLTRIINTPARGIGKASLDKIRQIANEHKMSMWDVIKNEMLTTRVPKGLAGFKEFIEKALEELKDVPANLKLSKFANNIFKNSGYEKSLTSEKSVENNSRLENIEEFINSIYEYERERPDITLDQFLQEISLLTSEENPNENVDDPNNIITLMTVHNTKGLEFPVVFLTGMEEGIFPHKFSQESDEAIEEERRLCYVGMTRAMDKLYLTNAELRRSFMGVDYKQVSRFIKEIPSEMIEVKNNSDSSSSYQYSSSKKTRNKEEAKNFEKAISSEKTFSSKNNSKFCRGDRIHHPKYGAGKIIRIEGTGDNTKLTISFGTVKKTFLEKYTPLEKFV